jgi:hypothetical protein
MPTAAVEGSNGAGLRPLPSLLEVLHNAEAPATMTIKVASATLPYTQPRQPKRPATPTVVVDRHGFAVDPVVARKLRNAIARSCQPRKSLGFRRVKLRQSPAAR